MSNARRIAMGLMAMAACIAGTSMGQITNGRRCVSDANQCTAPASDNCFACTTATGTTCMPFNPTTGTPCVTPDAQPTKYQIKVLGHCEASPNVRDTCWVLTQWCVQVNRCAPTISPITGTTTCTWVGWTTTESRVGCDRTWYAKGKYVTFVPDVVQTPVEPPLQL